MAAPCLHCAIRQVIQAHVRSHPDAHVDGKPVVNLLDVASKIGVALGEVAMTAPDEQRAAVVFEALKIALQIAGITAVFSTSAVGVDPAQPTAH